MELVNWEPFGTLDRFHTRINDLFEESFGRPKAFNAPTGEAWYPPVDILESKDSYLIRAELPGMKKEDFNLELKEGVLTLSGERKVEEPTNGVECHRSERLAGKFFRSFYLPQAIQHEGIKATYRDGILDVYVPKAEEAKSKQIPVSVN